MAYERDERRDARGQDDRYRSNNPNDDRGFFERAGDEVRSWFGDEDAERRRRQDERYDERGDYARDRSYGERDRSYGNASGNDRGYGAGGFGAGRSDGGRYGERSYGDRSYNERSSGDRSYGDRSYGDRSYGERSYGERGRESYSGGYDRDRSNANQGSNDRYARYEPGGYRSPDRAPSWVRSNRDENSGDRYGSTGYGSGLASQRTDEGRQFGDDYAGAERYGASATDRGYDYGSRDSSGGRGFTGDRNRSDRDQDYGAQQRYGGDRDRGASWSEDHSHYHDWRNRQIEDFDRDYDDYRRENRSRFQNEFSTWRQSRQTQRDQLRKVKEHQEVVGSDGEHVGTVDHVRGDHLLLTKNDRDAGGHHHSIPGAWVQSVDDRVTLNKTAAEAKREWKESEERGGLFGGASNAGTGSTASGSTLGGNATGSSGSALGGGTTSSTPLGGTSSSSTSGTNNTDGAASSSSSTGGTTGSTTTR